MTLIVKLIGIVLLFAVGLVAWFAPKWMLRHVGKGQILKLIGLLYLTAGLAIIYFAIWDPSL